MLLAWPLFAFAGYYIGHCGVNDPFVRAIAAYVLIALELPVLALIFAVGMLFMSVAVEAWRSREQRKLFIKRWWVSALWAALISAVAGLFGMVEAAGGCSWGW